MRFNPYRINYRQAQAFVDDILTYTVSPSDDAVDAWAYAMRAVYGQKATP